MASFLFRTTMTYIKRWRNSYFAGARKFIGMRIKGLFVEDGMKTRAVRIAAYAGLTRLRQVAKLISPFWITEQVKREQMRNV